MVPYPKEDKCLPFRTSYIVITAPGRKQNKLGSYRETYIHVPVNIQGSPNLNEKGRGPLHTHTECARFLISWYTVEKEEREEDGPEVEPRNEVKWRSENRVCNKAKRDGRDGFPSPPKDNQRVGLVSVV